MNKIKVIHDPKTDSITKYLNGVALQGYVSMTQSVENDDEPSVTLFLETAYIEFSTVEDEKVEHEDNET